MGDKPARIVMACSAEIIRGTFLIGPPGEEIVSMNESEPKSKQEYYQANKKARYI